VVAPRPPAEALFGRVPGLHVAHLRPPLRHTDKALTVAGYLNGAPVVVKVLLSEDAYWQERFARESGVYRAFTALPPPFTVPQLRYADDWVLVLQHLPGEPAHYDRYPPQLPRPVVGAMIAGLELMADWQPPPGVIRGGVDWPARITHEGADGHIGAGDRALLLAITGQRRLRFAHGDPLPGNTLMEPARQRVVWIDYEHAGPAPPGSDLALLGLLLERHDPNAQTVCFDVAQAAGVADSYLAMRMLWIARERRLYQHVFSDPDAPDMLEWLSRKAHVTAERLRRHLGST
jgi:choline/ethanolamine kinase